VRGHTCKIFITKYLDHDAGFVLPFVGSLAVCKTRQCPLSYAICMWCCRVQSLNLKGTPHKDASWPGNGENMANDIITNQLSKDMPKLLTAAKSAEENPIQNRQELAVEAGKTLPPEAENGLVDKE